MPETVLVTGGRGFVAQACVKVLLERGHTVRGTARKVPDPNPSADGVTWFQADLLEDGAFDQAVEGCSVVMHTASPYIVDVNDPQKDLVDPAVNGTINVLKSCAKTPGIKRVVLTSSVAAISDSPEKDKVYTEADWNEESSLDRNPYYFSKAKAERAAWDFVEALKDDAEAKSKFDLVVINPVLVLGPEEGSSMNTSNAIIKAILEGEYPMVMDLAWALVDVHDVGVSHVEAMEKESASGRHLCANETLHLRDIIAKLREMFPDYCGNVPGLDMSGGFGTCIAKIAANFQPKGVKSFLKTNLGRALNFDNSKIKKELGVEFTPIDETLRNTVQSLIDRGLVPKAQAKAEKAIQKREKAAAKK